MRIPPTLQVCSGVLFGVLFMTTGCTNPSSQSLASLSITATPSTVAVGGAVLLKATAHLSDGTTQDVTSGTLWTLSNSAMATVSNGALTAKAVGSLTVQAAYVEQTPAGASPSAANVTPQDLNASTTVTITPATGVPTPNVPAVTWAPPSAITYGTALSSAQLSATANVPGTFVYTPAAGAVLPAGQQTLSVLFTPTDTQTYSSATATVTLTVNQAAPTVTWATPAPVAAGATLGATQLDATATVPGSFLYSPSAGTVLAAGTQTLKVVFTPNDATDYSSATAQTALVVNGNSTPPTPPTPPVGCGGPTINLNSGASQSTLQSTIRSAPSCATIVLAAGTYGPITSTITIPCGISLSGPTVPYSQTPNQTATINGSSNFIGWGFQTTPGCSQAQTIQFLAWDGKLPSNGGGFLNVVAGTTNLTVQNNWLHGVNAPGASGGTQYNQADLIFLSGGPSGNTTNNVTIQWNIFGSTSFADCASAMNDTSSGEDDNGGLCGGVGLHNNVSNVSVTNNIFHWLEEPIKFFEMQAQCSPVTVSYNSITNFSRIGYETQCYAGTSSQPTLMYIQYNNVGTRYNSLQTYDISAANGCGNVAAPNCVTHTDYNVELQATQGPADVGLEIWGLTGTTASYNLLQGYLYNAITWSRSGQQTFNNNTFNIVNNGTNHDCATGSGGFWNKESYNNPAFTPTCTGNTFSNAINGTTVSSAPTISPAGGTFSGSQVVTITNPGTNRDTNTTDWCTTDGSTPIPGSGTAVGYYNGGTLTVTGNTTVQCVGMWGALNQPYSYPSGFAYVPSAVVSSSFAPALAPARKNKAMTAEAANQSASNMGEKVAPAAIATVTPTLQSITITPSQPVVSIGSTSQLVAIANFSDGSMKDVTSEVAWQSSDPRTVTTNAGGALSGLASGLAAISASYQGIQAVVSATSSIGDVNWSNPIVITEAGTYSGNWQSTDVNTPAVTIATTAPVVIENSHISSVGSLIKTTVTGINLTVRNSLGIAANAHLRGQPNGIFLDTQSPAKLDVENNYIENARGGVIVHGYAGSRDGELTIIIRGNRARNLNGLLSDGHNGYLPGEGASQTPAEFIQLDSLQSVPGVDVGWNEVINYPGHSLVQNSIEIFRSSGTPNRPLEIHDTYIQGAYPYNPAQDAYTGGGITTDAQPGDTAQEVPAFNSIHDNQVVGTASYGIQFAAGHDNVASNNRIISSGLLPDGSRIPAQNVGLANAYAPSAANYNNTMHDNVVGWACWQASCASQGYRRDQYFPASPADYSTNTVLPESVSLNMENNEYQLWMNKLVTSGVTVGPSF